MMCGRRQPGFWTLLTLVALTPAPAFAQVPALSRGSVILGGTASLEVANLGSDSGNLTTVAIAPHLDYFVTDGLAIGGDVRLVHVSRSDFSGSSILVGPAVAYYFGKEGTAHPFLRAGARWGRQSSSSGPNDQTITQSGVHAAAGVLFLVSDAVGVDASLYWDRTTDDPGGTFSTTFKRLGLALGVSAFVF